MALQYGSRHGREWKDNIDFPRGHQAVRNEEGTAQKQGSRQTSDGGDAGLEMQRYEEPDEGWLQQRLSQDSGEGRRGTMALRRLRLRRHLGGSPSPDSGLYSC
ncbi:hypothetical protein E4U30_006053 [Claviceps sp. LM220 group G6]|nr:hypothetical protein E4U30_006053 [Claviceps sp. LM220 group G6]KAG6114362.1 hypothetical protein E4U14_001433 [Claviceps sp. LM454 group G7]KAG6114880.1 hypothetical protein E4U31_000030 [Claviceps sp. LM219 group G6]